MRWLALVLVAMACTQASPTPTPDPIEACAGIERLTTLVETRVVGPVANTSVTLPITSTTGGELLVVAVASSTGDLGYVRMARAIPALQLLAGDSCDKSVVIWTVAGMPAGLSSFEVTHNSLTQPTSFVVFASLFAGTPWSASLRYGHGDQQALACPGDVLVSAATSCSAPVLAPDSPFTQLDVIDGFSSAYLIAPAPGFHATSWTMTEPLASTWIQF